MEGCVVHHGHVPDSEIGAPNRPGQKRADDTPDCATQADHEGKRREVPDQQVLSHVRGKGPRVRPVRQRRGLGSGDEDRGDSDRQRPPHVPEFAAAAARNQAGDVGGPVRVGCLRRRGRGRPRCAAPARGLWWEGEHPPPAQPCGAPDQRRLVGHDDRCVDRFRGRRVGALPRLVAAEPAEPSVRRRRARGNPARDRARRRRANRRPVAPRVRATACAVRGVAAERGEAGRGLDVDRRARLPVARLFGLPSDARNGCTRARRSRPHSSDVAHDARGGNDREHRGRPRQLDHRPAALQARKQDARAEHLRARSRCAARLPAEPEVVAVDVLPPRARQRVERLDAIWEERPGLLGWLTTVDHKRIGLLYFFTTLAFFLAGGVEALLIRTQLARPNERVLSPDTYNQVMTMHGVTMIFLFVIPMGVSAFGNYLVPLMIGARDMAFPRMNALSYWLFLGSGCFIYAGLFMHKGANCGWFCYAPLNTKSYDPGPNVDFYALGLIFNGLSTTAGAINFIVTIFKLRAPGMSLNRMPLFVFANLASSLAIIFRLPTLTRDLTCLELQRRADYHFYDVAHGGDRLLWQHLFWLFGHPEVYIIVLPAFGIATSIIPTFSKRRLIAFPLVALAELLVAFIGFGVWAHHMFATGLPTYTLILFAAASTMVVIPSTIQVFAWTLTVTMGKPEFRAPLLFIGGFIAFFVIGGLSGIMFAAIPFDQAVTDTYFVVAHFHFIIFGAAVFPIFGGMFYWFPKVTGRLYHERWAQASFWLMFVGTGLTFFPMHIVGLLGMTRRVYTYQPGLGWDG